MDEISNRVKKLIEESGFSNTEFASKIDVNPAIISHILSGRNKPSLQIIQKISDSFTNVNLAYLISGEGALFKEKEEETTNIASGYSSYNLPTEGVRPASIPGSADMGYQRKEKMEEETPPPLPSSGIEQTTENEIDKIVIFYKNGRFKAYRP